MFLRFKNIGFDSAQPPIFIIFIVLAIAVISFLKFIKIFTNLEVDEIDKIKNNLYSLYYKNYQTELSKSIEFKCVNDLFNFTNNNIKKTIE